MTPIETLKLIDKLCAEYDPDEQDQHIGQIYKIAHAFNSDNSCYNVHNDWRKQGEEINKALANY